MGKVLHVLKVVTINVVTFLVLLFIVNWLVGIYLKRTQATRDQLPNYANDREHARAIFRDYNSIQHEYYPFVGWKMLKFKGPTTTIDENGYRLHSSTSGGKSQRTVHFFGGSTMWGEGSDDQHTIPALYNESFPNDTVVNHGQLAYNTRQELDALISLYSKKVNPNLVIFYDGVNDAAFLCPSEIKELPAHRLVPMFRNKIYVSKTFMVKEALNKAFLENILKLIQRYSDPTKKASPYDCISDPDKAQEIADMFMMNWEMAHEIVTARGGKFIAVLQPAAVVGNPRTDHLDIDQDFKANFADVYRRIKEKIAEKKHPWIYDLSNVLDGSDYIFIDFCHVSSNGNEKVAKAIVDIVAQQQAL